MTSSPITVNSRAKPTGVQTEKTKIIQFQISGSAHPQICMPNNQSSLNFPALQDWSYIKMRRYVKSMKKIQYKLRGKYLKFYSKHHAFFL